MAISDAPARERQSVCFITIMHLEATHDLLQARQRFIHACISYDRKLGFNGERPGGDDPAGDFIRYVGLKGADLDVRVHRGLL